MSGKDTPNVEAPKARVTRPRAATQRKQEHLLTMAAALIARKGYDQTAIRDVGRESGVSLPGMYYYFKSKEDLLFQIQQKTFSSLLEAQQAAFAIEEPPDHKLRHLIVGHLAFYARHPNEMKVCTFELESLRDAAYHEIRELRRRYYHLVATVVDDILARDGRSDPGGLLGRHFTLFVFGMLNWIFMWFDPARDGPVERLGEEMSQLVLHGLARGDATQLVGAAERRGTW